ncbi:MAG: methyltransferase type 11 [Candidatus Gottesmanbacteria bacterium GW2011_GWA2_43_14]|uniref:Methyltransferase type 11 n=1 Tax=Candidatus Gottesmanbacteria bacterium GW2011_GWA2_43_14 TaxID=1618443 RepID=A0A0G1DIX2_9BACT|nr:MAG: methyltransferase type 11 [Candidatus Gottesmanbacteria bacterium GW2011_GWA2_43_14]
MIISIITPLHKRTKRDYLGRMQDDKVHCMKVAKKYGRDYWDGDRRYGYGGYKYDGRWSVVADKLIKKYKLTNKSKILDVGCGKGFLLYEIKKLLPGASVAGFDISRYGLKNSKKEIRQYLHYGRAEGKYPYKNREFDLVISITALHNLTLPKLSRALAEIERVGRQKYLAVESYRNEKELFNLECWALTCEAFFDKESWIWVLKHFGYTGDFEFIYF